MCPYICNHRVNGVCPYTACINPKYNRYISYTFNSQSAGISTDFIKVVRCKNCTLRGSLDCPMVRLVEWDNDGYPDYDIVDDTDDDFYCGAGLDEANNYE